MGLCTLYIQYPHPLYYIPLCILYVQYPHPLILHSSMYTICTVPSPPYITFLYVHYIYSTLTHLYYIPLCTLYIQYPHPPILHSSLTRFLHISFDYLQFSPPNILCNIQQTFSYSMSKNITVSFIFPHDQCLCPDPH